MAKTLGDLIAEARARIEEVSADDLEAMIDAHNDLLIVDVREAWEYRVAHLPAARLVPRGTLEGAADPHYRHRDPVLCQAYARPLVLYCQTGGRSALAVATLNDMGFREVYNLAGGIDLWEAEDYAIETGPGAGAPGAAGE